MLGQILCIVQFVQKNVEIFYCLSKIMFLRKKEPTIIVAAGVSSKFHQNLRVCKVTLYVAVYK